MSAPQPLDFTSGIGCGPQDAAFFSHPFLVTEFIRSPFDRNQRQAKIGPALLGEQLRRQIIVADAVRDDYNLTTDFVV